MLFFLASESVRFLVYYEVSNYLYLYFKFFSSIQIQNTTMFENVIIVIDEEKKDMVQY